MVYSPGSPYVVTSSTTLYAVWTLAPKAPVVSQLAGAIGPFLRGSSVLGATLKIQIHNIANSMKSRDYASASMFGYALANEKVTNINTLSSRRATAVENYLRGLLVEMRVEPVVMHGTGEGLVKGSNSAVYRRVEVFLKL
jgi:outer membrane protein OmpA-like peptidoglycan-associated protein